MAERDTQGTAPESLTLDPTTLPINKYKAEIVTAIFREQFVVIEGSTGCGKSSMVPQFIIDDCNARGERAKIIVTQPRRIACVTLAGTVASMRKTDIGDLVGYQISRDVKVSENCQLVYSTTGFFVESLLGRLNSCQGYTHIILDEVHERDLQMDLLLCIVREWMPLNSFKLIIMSATLQEDLICDYFAESLGDRPMAPPIRIDGKCYKVDIYHLDDMPFICDNEHTSLIHQAVVLREKLQAARHKGPCMDKYMSVAYDICVNTIMKYGEAGKSLLVFLPGMREIEKFTDILHGKSADFKAPLKLVCLHSQMNREEQEEAFREVPGNKCQVIAATNVAETSVTLPSVHIVIDLGFQRELKEDVMARMARLITRESSTAASKQRAGRTGRRCPGKVFRLFCRRPKKTYDAAHITHVPLEDLVLRMKFLVKHSFPELTPTALIIRLLEPPEYIQVQCATFKLAQMGMITCSDDSADITAIGFLARRLPIDLELSRVIFFGVHFGIPCEAVVLAAIMSCPKLLYLPRNFTFKHSGSFVHSLRESLSTCFRFDDGHYSEPIMNYNIFKCWLEFFVDYCHKHEGKRIQRSQVLAEFSRDKAICLKPLCLVEDRVLEISIALSRRLDPSSQALRSVMQLCYQLTCLRSQLKFDGNTHEPVHRSAGCDSDSSNTKHNFDTFTNLLNADALILKTVLLCSFNHNVAYGDSYTNKNQENPSVRLKVREEKYLSEALTVMQRAGANVDRSVLLKSKTGIDILLTEFEKCFSFESKRLEKNSVILTFNNRADQDVLGADRSRVVPCMSDQAPKVLPCSLEMHLLRGLMTGTSEFSFKTVTVDGKGEVWTGHIYQPSQLKWKLCIRNMTGYLDRYSIVGNAGDTRLGSPRLMAVVSKYIGIQDVDRAIFDNVTILPVDDEGVFAWLLVLCFHPAEMDLSLLVVEPFGTVQEFFSRENILGRINPTKSRLRLSLIAKINAIRKDISRLAQEDDKKLISRLDVRDHFDALINDYHGIPHLTPQQVAAGNSVRVHVKVKRGTNELFPPIYLEGACLAEEESEITESLVQSLLSCTSVDLLDD